MVFEIAAEFNDLINRTEVSDNQVRINQIIDDILKETEAVRFFSQFLGMLTEERVSQIISRQLLSCICNTLSSLPAQQAQPLCEVALNCLNARAISFEEQVTEIKKILADIYQKKEEWAEAARMLSTIPLDSGQRNYEDAFKLDIYLKITQLQLEADDSVAAESSLNRATALVSQSSCKSSQIIYKACHARILDHRRKYLEAGQKYHEMSLMEEISDVDRTQALEKAIHCALLAPAGVHRTRLIGTFYKDERAAGLKSCFSLLEKVFLQRLISADEVTAFSSVLMPHHQAITHEGWTLVQRAVIEHNLLAVSALYRSVTFENLGKILGISAAKAEKVAARMIQEERMTGEIDQVDNVVRFIFDDEDAAWNSSIKYCCEQLNSIVEKIAAKHPEWYEKNNALVSAEIKNL